MTDTVFRTYETPNGRWFRAWTEGVRWEDEAHAQVLNLLQLPFVKQVAVMADTHWGKGGPVGVAVKFEGAIIPAVIGVDIGCGMRPTLLQGVSGDELTPEVCQALLRELGNVIPHGITPGVDRGSWCNVPEDVKAPWFNDHNGEELSLEDQYAELLFMFGADPLRPARIAPLRNGATIEHRDPLSQLGTLGSGNHFFEVSVDELNRVWLVVHSGSRGAGARIGDFFTKRAGDLMDRWFIKLPGTKNRKTGEVAPDRNLAYIPEGEPEYQGYIDCMRWAQSYARLNRSLMMRRAIDIALPRVFKRWVGTGDIDFDIHHNYLDTDTLIARKGAVHVRRGEPAIIPGAMGKRTYIVRGLPGLEKSMETCSHGAGRAMSRTDAERLISMEQHQRNLVGLACDSSEDTLDEDPDSYKDIDAVIHAQRDLVEPLHILTAKVCVKGKSLKLRRR